MTMGFANLFLL